MEASVTGEPTIEDREIALREVYENPEFDGKAKFRYEYDFGDGWERGLSLIWRATLDSKEQMSAPDELTAWCLGSEGHSVAEDSGAAPRWKI